MIVEITCKECEAEIEAEIEIGYYGDLECDDSCPECGAEFSTAQLESMQDAYNAEQPFARADAYDSQF